MTFCFDLLPAKKGDCFLLHFGQEEDTKAHRLILIDGGPRGVYADYLKDRLTELRQQRNLGDQDALPIELLMVSHVDDDHIQGILDLTYDEIVALDTRRPRKLNVLSFWHNSFDAIIDDKPTVLVQSAENQFGEASVTGAGDLPEQKLKEVEDAYKAANPSERNFEHVRSAVKVLASISQGYRLRLAAEKLDYSLNPEFGNDLVVARKGDEPITFADGLKLTVVGPMDAEICALRAEHQAWLRRLRREGRPLPEVLASYVDRSVSNLSSIVVLAEYEGKRMLLTGDARGDKVLQGLELVGLLEPGGRIEVDLLKVPHHGSANNLDKDFFERIHARHYVFSGDGEHGNPEREALEILFEARQEKPLTIHLTYPLAAIDLKRAKDWAEQREREEKRRQRGEDDTVRAVWSSSKQGLVEYFNTHPLAAGQSIEIVQSGKPHLINL